MSLIHGMSITDQAAAGNVGAEHRLRFIYGDADKNIPPQASAFMAERAHARETVAIKGASHVVMVSNPGPVARLIENAAREISR